MFKTLLQSKSSSPKSPKAATFILRQSNQYIGDIQQQLNNQIDKRLVRTFYDLFITITMFRNRVMGLIISELGGYICGFDHAPAGTKRISNLLRSKKWKADLIGDFFFNRTIKSKRYSSFNVKGR